MKMSFADILLLLLNYTILHFKRFVFSEAAMGIQINAQINSNSEYITAVDR